MRARITWLDAGERELIRTGALDILERVGLRMRGSASLAALAEAGAHVDAETGVVRFPPPMVEAALAHAPREFVLGGLTEADDVRLAEGQPTAFCPSGCAALTLDEVTLERRPSTLEDLRRSTILLDETRQVRALWTTVTANDVPLERREALEHRTVFGETRKHVTLVDCPERAEPLVELATVLAGDLARFAARPRFSTVLTVASPLQVEGRLLDVHAAVARLGAPVEVFTLPLPGGTGPVTAAGTLALAFAEFLGVATALQTLSPGARVIMGAAGVALDMRSGQISYAAPECTLFAAAAVEVAHELGFPVICSGMASDAKYAGIQAGYEKALKGVMTAGTGADLMSGGIGLLDSANLLFLPQIVIDAEVAAMIERVVGGAEISRETLLLDAVARVGIGGSYLSEKETSRRLRAGEQFLPRVSTRLPYDAWAELGKDEVGTAWEQAQKTLAGRTEPLPYLSADQRRAFDRACGEDALSIGTTNGASA